MRKLIIIILIFQAVIIQAQKWVDTSYQIEQINDIVYGNVVDFAGNERSLLMNICYPKNDLPPRCGRPLLIAIHGGAFLAGNKDTESPPRWLTDFAKRGYTTASINYRLGMFQTNAEVNCNISAFGVPWNCLNMQDTAEWYRGYYRGMQDAKGALRFLVNHAAEYQIDPKNIFLVGESAGGFVALATAFLDDPTEKPLQCSSLPNALPPNKIYENQCIQSTGFDTSIASMKLVRPDLGSVEGILNPTATNYKIKGVGNFYGGMMGNYFLKHTYSKAPVLYLFHQPNDLVVPIESGIFYQGAGICYSNFPTYCQSIINRPRLIGSLGIKNMIDSLNGKVEVPKYLYETTNNFADCLGQFLDPNTAGHSIDNYWLRTLNMAKFFAPEIDTTSNCIVKNNLLNHNERIQIYPNPIVEDEINIQTDKYIISLQLYDIQGILIRNFDGNHNNLRVEYLKKGMYFLKIKTNEGENIFKIVKYF